MCKWWTETLHDNAKLTNTHDLGFMICPWSIPAWELLHDERAYHTTITAAKSLLSRFDSRANCLRSWDSCITKRYSFQKPEDGFLVIIVRLFLSVLFVYALPFRCRESLELMVLLHFSTRTIS
jgi:hypothetical protein